MRARLAGFDLLERLGGTRSSVHRALEQGRGRVVVVKSAPWHDVDAAAALGREAHVLSRVAHPNLRPLLSVVEDEQGRALVLAHAPGGTLAERVTGGGPRSAHDVAGIGAQLAGALSALHEAGVVHRDVAVDNVLFDPEDVVWLADLDAALDQGAPPVARDDQVVGSVASLDPQVHAGAPPRPSSDLYALACVLWEALTGAPPHGDGDDGRVLAAASAGIRPTLERVRPDAPAALAATLRSCLAPERRHDAAEVAAELEAARLDALARAPQRDDDLLRGDLPDGVPPDGVPPGAVVRGDGPPAAAHPPEPPRRRRAPPSDDDAPPRPPTTPAVPAVTAPTGTTRRRVGRGTREFGPRPPGPATAGDPGGGRRLVALAGAAVVVLIPLLVLALTRGDHARPAPEAVVPPQACADAPSLDGDVVLIGDLEGEGCSRPLAWSDGVLTTAGGDRFALGAAGDVPLLGDWDGDGDWTPGLYQPDSGVVTTFDELGDEVRTRPPIELAPGGAPVVVDPDGDGRHTVVLR